MSRESMRQSEVTLPMLLLCFAALIACRPTRYSLPAGAGFQTVQGHGEAADTSPPSMPKKLMITPDTTLIVARPDSGDFYYRTLLQVAFADTTRGISIKRVLLRYQATVVGGYPKLGPLGTYVVQVPDRGKQWPPLAALVDSIRAEPGVFSVGPMPFRARLNERDSL